jgi:hypothetical protein
VNISNHLDFDPLDYDTVQFCRWLPMFQINLLSPSVVYLEDGDSRFLYSFAYQIQGNIVL